MKVAVLAVATNIHANRWINALAERGIHVLLITQQPPLPGEYRADVRIALLPFRGRFAYALNAPILRWLYDRSGADFLHVHYAGGYGAMAWLSGIRRRLISVWGGDVYDVPERSPLHRLLVVGALEGATRITSTSHVMARQVERLGVSRPIDVVPFGVDTRLFTPAEPSSAPRRLTIGTIKTLTHKYGIDTLIQGFAMALEDPDFAALDPQLRIGGGGVSRGEYERLGARLGLSSRLRFAGAIAHRDVPAMLRQIDIFVAMSRDDSESFGVAVIEASACGLPVVVSEAGGLPEVVEDKKTGLVIARDRPHQLADALRRLAGDPALRRRLGEAGRARVKEHYEWRRCVDRMCEIYEGLAGGGAPSGHNGCQPIQPNPLRTRA